MRAMRKWWESKGAAWGEALVLQALGYFLTQANPLIGGIVWGLLFLLGGFLIWRAYRKRDIENNTELTNYIDKVIVDSKAPSVLAITDTLQQMSDIEATTTSIILSRKRHVKISMLNKMQVELKYEVDVKPNYKFPIMEDAKQRELIMDTIKKLRLPKEYNEELIRIFLAITFVLDEHDKGLTKELENNEPYDTLKKALSERTAKLSDDKSGVAVSAHRNTSLGLNSLILYISYFPQNFKNMYTAINKPLSQFKHERDELLKALLIIARNAIEGELRGK